MYSLVCRMNHSCRANAAYHFKLGGAVTVRTTVNVEADEEVCISYLDAMQPLARHVNTHGRLMFLILMSSPC